MGDWFDEQVGGLCKSLQDEIKSNPFLAPAQKEEFVKWLEECASKAATGDVGAFNRELGYLNSQYHLKSGKPLSRAYVA